MTPRPGHPGNATRKLRCPAPFPAAYLIHDIHALHHRPRIVAPAAVRGHGHGRIPEQGGFRIAEILGQTEAAGKGLNPGPGGFLIDRDQPAVRRPASKAGGMRIRLLRSLRASRTGLIIDTYIAGNTSAARRKIGKLRPGITLYRAPRRIMGMSSWGSGHALQASPTGFDSPRLHVASRGTAAAAGLISLRVTVTGITRRESQHPGRDNSPLHGISRRG